MGGNSISKLAFTISKTAGGTNISLLLQHSKDEVDNHVILISKDLDDSLGDPSKKKSSANIHESDILCNELTWDELFHNFKVDFFPIDLFRVFRRELGALEELRVNTAGHDYRLGRWVRNRAINDGEWKKARRAKDGKRVERGW